MRLCKRLMLTRLHVDKEIYKEMRNAAQSSIRKNETGLLRGKNENTANPKKNYGKRLYN